ncbi:sensor histidine kinase [Roseomonas mucosa]|uniref:sensor histidine kinase n=1 Tax=Roseomonas TaxID=125216 RepID=UPI0015C56D1B|nr:MULTISPECIES: sensor histidine kinase [Roseomonas]
MPAWVPHEHGELRLDGQARSQRLGHGWTSGQRLAALYGGYALLVLLVVLAQLRWTDGESTGPVLLSGLLLLLGLGGVAWASRTLVVQPVAAAARRLEEGGPLPVASGLAGDDYDEHQAPAEIAELVQRLGAARATQEEAVRLRDLLLRESHHRLKNHLTLLGSFLRMQERQIDDPAALAALRAAQGRMMAIAATYDLMHEAGAAEVSLDGMLERLARALPEREGSAVPMDTELAPVSVPADVAVKLGLVVNELATHALRHGPPGGRVRIVLRAEGDGLVLLVSDEGQGQPEGPKGLGMTIAEGLARALGARLGRLPPPQNSWEVAWSPRRDPARNQGQAAAS